MEQHVLLMQIRKDFNDDITLRISMVKNENNEVALIFLSGLADASKISELIIKPFVSLNSNIFYLPYKELLYYDDAKKDLLSGNALVIDGEIIYSFDVKQNLNRSISEPKNESSEEGNGLGLIENIESNIALIRRGIKTDKLKVISINQVSLMYLSDKVDYKKLEYLIERFRKIDAQVDNNLIRELLMNRRYSIIDTIGMTERPDVAIKYLNEGRIISLVDYSSHVLIAPYYLKDNFVVADDDYINFFYASFNRILRILSFILAVIVPGLYLSLVMYHQEIIPTSLLESIIDSKNGVPFPSYLELLIMLIAFDLIRETGSKIPSNLSTALSIVAGLILGQAVVDAKIVSKTAIIVVSLASLSGLVNPHLKGVTIFFRTIIFFLALLMGFQGILFALTLIMAFLCSVKSLDDYYLSGFFSFNYQNVINTYFRLPLRRKK